MFSPDQSEKVGFLFEECVEISDSVKQKSFLDTACPDNPEIRDRVERLLKAHEACGNFLFGATHPNPQKWGTKPGISSQDIEPGGRIGPYRLLGVIGEGSTSTVFLAEQEDPVHRWVALKVVKLGMDSRKVIQRFSLERQALALMDHPGIAKLLDAGATSSGRPFFIMELVSGSGITTFCDEHALSVPKRLELFTGICSAVSHAHQRGIIHRDIKPDNILVTDDDGAPSLKIIDFGIAKVLQSWHIDKITQSGLIPFLGTPAYMSPEQIHLNAPELDTRTDIYSMGALLYELLTGHPPFDHERLISAGLEDMFRIITNEEPPPPSSRIARLPRQEQLEVAKARGTTPTELVRALKDDLDWITLKALEKNPDRRYPTAECIAQDIKRHFKHYPVAAAAPSKCYRLVKMLKRNRKLVTASGTVGLLLLASTILISTMALSARRSTNQAREMEQAVNAAEELSHQALIAKHVSSGMSAASDNCHDEAFLWFATSAKLAKDSPIQKDTHAQRALNWISKVPLPIGAFKLNSNFRAFEFSADSRFLLALCNDSDWCVWDCETRQPAAWPNKPGPVKAAAWSPGGSQLALVLPAGEIRIYDPSDGRLLHAITVNPAPDAIVFSPDSRHLVFGGPSLQIYDLDAGRTEAETFNFDRNIVGLVFANDSNMVVGVSDTGWAQMFEFQDGLRHRLTKAREFPHLPAIRTDSCSIKSKYEEDFLKTAVLSLPAVTPNAKRLLTRTGSYLITLWDLVHGRVLDSIEDACCSCRFIICPDSELFACGIQGGKVGIWELETARQTQMLPSKGACVLDIAFGNHGKSLITAETTGRARVWSIEQGVEIQPPLNHCTDVDRVAYSQNGLLVATGQSDGLIRVWNVMEAQPAEHNPDRGEVPSAVRMDEQGTRFVLTREPSWDPNCEACLSQLVVYSAFTGKSIGDPIPLDACVEAAAFSSDGNLLIVGTARPGNTDSGRLEIHPLINGDEGREIIRLDSRPADLAWNPIRKEVAVICRGGELICFNLSGSPQIRWRKKIDPANTEMNPSLKFSHNGDTLVTLGPDNSIQVLESSTGKLRYPPLVTEFNDFWSISISPDENHLAASTSSGNVFIWDLATGKAVGNPLKHTQWVYRCRFSQDQKFLITACHDGKVRIWDWQSGQLATAPLPHPNAVYDATFTPDSKWILTASRDGMVRIWEPIDGTLIAPPVRVGHQAFNIEFNSLGTSALVGNLCKQFHIISLENLQQTIPYNEEYLCQLAEVASSSRIESGSLHTLTTDEWIQLYNTLKQAYPDSLLPSGEHGLQKKSVTKPVSYPSITRVEN